MSEILTLSTEDIIEHRLNALRHERNLWHRLDDHWPVEPGTELRSPICSFRDPHRRVALVERGDALARATFDGGMAWFHCFGDSPGAAAKVLEELRQEIPRAAEADPGFVPVTFWSLSPHGPQSIRRLIDAPAWDEIRANYPDPEAAEKLLREWSPGMGGQLLLWHGDAGTGKTTALRSLGREWRDWAELHYIVDPDKFFGESAAYMMQVMMGGGEGKLIVVEGEEAEEPPWRVLVLEDCAEMLAPDARRDVGQALSRLLNACDGLIGRGLRLLILITTNEPLEKVHPAVSRPGRCAARIEFERFTPLLARDWLERHLTAFPEHGVAGSLTLADLYAIREGHRSEAGKRPVGFAAA